MKRYSPYLEGGFDGEIGHADMEEDKRDDYVAYADVQAMRQVLCDLLPIISDPRAVIDLYNTPQYKELIERAKLLTRP